MENNDTNTDYHKFVRVVDQITRGGLQTMKRHVAAFFKASVLKEVCILCVIYTITIPKFQNKADYIS